MRKFQSFAAMDRDQRDGITRVLVFRLALGVQRNFLEESLQALERRFISASCTIQCGDQFLEVANTIFGSFRILLGAAEFGEVIDLIQEIIRPTAKEVSLIARAPNIPFRLTPALYPVDTLVTH